MTNDCSVQAAEWFFWTLSSETLKTIQEFLNNGFVYRMKSLREHLILCQTVLNTEKKVQLFWMEESKEYIIKY